VAYERVKPTYFPPVTLTFTTPLNTDTKSVGPDDTLVLL